MKRLAALSMLLVMLCSAFMVGTAASAAEPGTADPDQLGEVLELREKNSETYRLEDGSYECVVFAEDKYFEDETGNITYELHDVYDWEQDNRSLGIIPVTQWDMWELHYGGMAKNSEVYGINTLTLTWTAGQTIGNGVVISNEN